MESGLEVHPIDELDRLGEALHDCINKLSLQQRDCVDLFYLKKKSYREIALLMKYDEQSVKSYIQNGKRNLKICLELKDEREK